MRDRKPVGGMIILVCLVVVIGYYGLVPHRPRAEVTRESFARIRPGMTRAEVEALLGPPGVLMTGPDLLNPAVLKKAQEAADGRFSVWLGDEGAVRVDFDASGKVSDCCFLPIELKPSDREER